MNTESDDMKEHFEDLQDDAREAAQTLKERAQERMRAAQDGVRDFARNSDEYVHEHPWGVIGLTAVFAFAVGFILGSRRD